MNFTEITYGKTVEGNYEVSLVNNNTVVVKITFPTEFLANEYVELKKKLKADIDWLTAQVKQDYSKVVPTAEKVATIVETDTKKIVAAVEAEASVVVKDVEQVASKVVAAAESAVQAVENTFKPKQKVERQQGIDVSAKVGTNPVIDTSAKAAKDTIVDTSAKVVFPE